MGYHWREEKRQKTWLWVGLLFFVFYFTEALLFWGPEPRVAAPSFTPLVFWGLFGAALIWVVTRPTPDGGVPNRLERIQSWVLGMGITTAAVGSAFLIIRRTGDLALGHAVLLFVLGQAGLVIGAVSFNAGWLMAALCWIAGGMWVLCQPSIQDLVIGAAVAIGFMLIGFCRKCLVCQGVEGLTGGPGSLAER
jgi:hypothetical protein